MSVEIRGLPELMAELESRYGQQEMTRITDEALIAASLVYKQELIAQLSTFSGISGTTGATVDEVTFSDPYWIDGVRTITVHWRGPKGRYRVIHLNEFGTVKNPNPRGKGAIARSLQISERAYKEEIENVLGRSV